MEKFILWAVVGAMLLWAVFTYVAKNLDEERLACLDQLMAGYGISCDYEE